MKKILLILSVVAVAVFGTYTATQSSNSIALDDLQIENLEALGNEEEKWCPWGVAEYYVARDNKYNNSHSVFCDCTPVTYMLARRQCDGTELCGYKTWESIVQSGNY